MKSMNLNRFSGIALIASGLLFLSMSLLNFLAGFPPSTGAEILVWSTLNRTLLSFANETFFFAAVLLIPAVFAIYRTIADRSKALAVTACGLVAIAIPVMVVLDIVHGRLVYPVFGIQLQSPETAKLIVSVVYGGLHTVGIIFGIGTILLSILMRHGGYGWFVVLFGLIAGILDILGAYPSVLGPALTFVCQVFFSGWFIVVGSKLQGMTT